MIMEVASLIQVFLEQRSLHVDICDDPFNAVVTPLEKYSLVLLDLGLPGMDGLEVWPWTCKRVRFLLLSPQLATVRDKVMGLQIGADDYLPKPYDPDELYARISSLLRRWMLYKKPSRAFVIDTKAHDVLLEKSSFSHRSRIWSCFTACQTQWQCGSPKSNSSTIHPLYPQWMGKV